MSSRPDVVSREEYERIGREDTELRRDHREEDTRATLLLAGATLLFLGMLATGPFWVLLALVGENRHSASFEALWIVPVALAVASLLPLALALRRGRTRGRFAFGVLIVASLAVLLVLCPWL